jgi:Zn-dependent peptidase ImmA (M78 family)
MLKKEESLFRHSRPFGVTLAWIYTRSELELLNSTLLIYRKKGKAIQKQAWRDPESF